MEPNREINYLNLGGMYMALNRPDEAEVVYNQAQERKLEGEILLGNRYALAFLKGDAVQMAQMLSSAMGKPGTEDLLLAAQADTEAWYGRSQNAQELTRRAMDSAEHNDAKETAALSQVEGALREVEMGYGARARAEAIAALQLAPTRDVRAMAALVLATAGDVARAEMLAAELSKTFSRGTLVQRYWLPAIRAAIVLEKKDPKRVIDLLKDAEALELGTPNNLVILVPVYVRGKAYLALGNGDLAANEFQKFIDHRTMVGNFPWGALARLGLARAYALQAQSSKGDAVDAARIKARAAYQDFLTLWNEADPGVPVFMAAKSEYAKLK